MDKADRARQQFREFITDCGVKDLDLTNKSILELGFGNGLFLECCEKAGMKVAGLEVTDNIYKQTAAKFPHMNLKLYDGFHIPTIDDNFDYVVSFQVLEHVKSMDMFITESARVLKPGGLMYHRFPNYCSFYEGHYKIMWLPFLNKVTGRIYLKLTRQYSDYYESLNLTKIADIRRLYKQNADSIELLSDGSREFESRFNLAQASKISAPRVRKAAKFVVTNPPIRKSALFIMKLLNMHCPLMMIARKRHSSNIGN